MVMDHTLMYLSKGKVGWMGLILDDDDDDGVVGWVKIP